MFISFIFAAAIGVGVPESSAPVSSEADVWRLVQRVDSPRAYELYQKRFPAGPHAREARSAFFISQGLPLPPPAPPAPLPPPPVITLLPSNFVIDACTAMLISPTTEGDRVEGAVYRQKRRSNRVSDYEEFLKIYPTGVCHAEALKIIKTRAARLAKIGMIDKLGPLAAHRLTRNFITEDDYPPSAIRNEEQGTVVAEWDVSEDGTVEMCRVAVTSQSKALDEATCQIIARRVRYDPARNGFGVPIRAIDRMTIAWSLPADEPPTKDPAKSAN